MVISIVISLCLWLIRLLEFVNSGASPLAMVIAPLIFVIGTCIILVGSDIGVYVVFSGIHWVSSLCHQRWTDCLQVYSVLWLWLEFISPFSGLRHELRCGVLWVHPLEAILIPTCRHLLVMRVWYFAYCSVSSHVSLCCSLFAYFKQIWIINQILFICLSLLLSCLEIFISFPSRFQTHCWWQSQWEGLGQSWCELRILHRSLPCRHG